MSSMCFRLLLAFLLIFVQHRDAPFLKEIEAFRRADEIHAPAKGQILLIGSSSFTRWTEAQQAFPKHRILNRAFGGSTLLDVTRYVEDVVTPYAPKQVIMYCGENDFAADPALSPSAAFARFVALYRLVREASHEAPFVYVSMKPSPSRWNLAPKFRDTNAKIKRFLERQRNTAYVDVWPVMLGSDGKPNPDLYVSDNLHMNARGYALWTPLIEKALR